MIKEMSYIITAEEADRMIAQFIAKKKNIATKEALGGIIHKESIDGSSSAIYTGNMGWLCDNVNKSHSNYPKLFLAFERNSNYTADQEIEEPQSSVLVAPTITFISSSDAWPLLKDHMTPIPTSDNIIDKPTVIDLKNEFKKQEKENKKYSKEHPYCFFENKNNTELSVLMENEDIKYFRYYFGYSDDQSYGNNKMRLILVPVAAKGNNLVPDPGQKKRVSSSGGEVYILQKSWPPDSSNLKK
ncbi:hypothetical protein AB9P05_22175 [Roseivirga sp. BDSF3-8]|uniref:hypothetical protein n=1 Tax=Roseivirga sp. BDSF3-8 TaxID=3241598 RepID=UPI003531F048